MVIIITIIATVTYFKLKVITVIIFINYFTYY